MQLSHMSDRPVDLKTQMQDLTRNTTDILLLEIPMIDNSNEPYFDVKRITDMDWDDATHEVHTEFVPRHRLRGLDRTLLTILVKNDIKGDLDTPSRSTLLSVSVLLAHYHTEYHTRYIPLGWNFDVIETINGKYACDQREYHLTGGVALATLRCLAIQLGVQLAIESNPLINTDVMDNYRIDGMPEHAETEFLRYGTDHLMKLVKDTQPSN
jgi:hypothetical protein